MIKIYRTAPGKTYKANQLPDRIDNNGATWTNQGSEEDYTVHYDAHTKKFKVELIEWNEETQEWDAHEVPENEHPNLTVYIP